MWAICESVQRQRTTRLLAVSSLIVLIVGMLSGLTRLHAAQNTPTTIVVNTASDSNSACDSAVSLRCAIDFANNNLLTPTLITFADDYTIYVSSQMIFGIDEQSIEINAGRHHIVIDGNSQTRIFWTQQGQVTLTGLTFRHGYDDSDAVITGKGGGAILNGGNLTINDSLFYGNTGADGGSISTLGSLTINNSVFTGNSAYRCGGVLYNGAGHFDDSSITILNNVEMAGNFAGVGFIVAEPVEQYGADGGAICNAGALIINHSILSNNTASSGGGAIYTGIKLTLNNSTLSNNLARLEGGAIASENFVTINGSTFSGNGTRGMDTQHGLGGGAISMEHPTDQMVITNSTFYSNYDVNGGGGAILALGDLTVSSSTFTNNVALSGGGIYVGDKSTFKLLMVKPVKGRTY